MFLEPKEAQENVIDFKEYLLHALLLIKMQEPKIELLKLLFMVSEPRLPINLWVIYDQFSQLYSDSGSLDRSTFNKILSNFMKNPSKRINDIFNKFNEAESITFESFHKATENDERFKVLYEPNRNFRQKKL